LVIPTDPPYKPADHFPSAYTYAFTPKYRSLPSSCTAVFWLPRVQATTRVFSLALGVGFAIAVRS
jgi:hypothetical protein